MSCRVPSSPPSSPRMLVVSRSWTASCWRRRCEPHHQPAASSSLSSTLIRGLEPPTHLLF
uniref:Uncharacterized protein n=1 Tax=Arundo donax TaxID=35708 RepID=A0A0A8ZCL2_ARUDO